jgi:hypothetical protein
LIADAGADQPISLSFILLFFFVNLRAGTHAKEPVFVGMSKESRPSGPGFAFAP